MNNTPDYYEVLGLDITASEDDIEDRYRALCVVYDDNGIDHHDPRYQALEEAYRVLSYAKSREDYDNKLRERGLYRPAPEIDSSDSDSPPPTSNPLVAYLTRQAEALRTGEEYNNQSYSKYQIVSQHTSLEDLFLSDTESEFMPDAEVSDTTDESLPEFRLNHVITSVLWIFYIIIFVIIGILGISGT